MSFAAVFCVASLLVLASAHSHGHGHGHDHENDQYYGPEKGKFHHRPVKAPVEHGNVKPSGPLRSHFLYEDLGHVLALNSSEVLHFVLSNEKVVRHFGLEGVTLVFRASHSYKDVVTTFRYDQLLNGLPVYGGDLAVHIFQSSLLVHGVTGNIISSRDVPKPSVAGNLSPEIIQKLESQNGHFGVKVTQKPSLMYVIDDADVGRLCFHIRVLSHKTIGMTGRTSLPTPHTLATFPTPTEPYDVYIDAITHEIVMDVSVYQRALFRQVFDVQHGKTLPGVLVRKEGDPPVSDDNVNQAYDNAGRCYTFYWNIFGRDSWDNQGSPLNSSVHYEVNYDNAFWNGEQMVYGDGDGVIFANFTNDQTVICHELTHAVTQSTSQLRYWYESGSLNEAFSDIMGSSSYVYTTDPVLDRPDPETSWILGPNVTLVNLNPTGCPDCPPGTRYMNNPPLDGSSRDYYPDRYTGFEDDRGVHWNSGIANLAYVLTVQGGVHPQEKTDVYVEPIGIVNAQQIYYLGFTQYLTATSVYVDARAATQKAAQVLYPTSQPIYDSVGNAWSAVGVDAA